MACLAEVAEKTVKKVHRYILSGKLKPAHMLIRMGNNKYITEILACTGHSSFDFRADVGL
jgi:hypothetical protein